MVHSLVSTPVTTTLFLLIYQHISSSKQPISLQKVQTTNSYITMHNKREKKEEKKSKYNCDWTGTGKELIWFQWLMEEESLSVNPCI